MAESTYIRAEYKRVSGAPKTVDGIVFLAWRTGILRYARISEDGQIKVNLNTRSSGYNAYVIGHGQISGKNGKGKSFREDKSAYAAAIAIFRKMQKR